MTAQDLVAARRERVNSILSAVGAPANQLHHTAASDPASNWDNRATWDNWSNRT
jgi:hypothetical protein